jgi:putative ubiquitin-RnfH superfamily antitoxin RatB of RatAB toxin-antitoxin module
MSINQGYVWVPYIMSTDVAIVGSFNTTSALKSRYSTIQFDSNFYGIYTKLESRDEKLNKLLYPLLYDPDSLGSSDSHPKLLCEKYQ